MKPYIGQRVIAKIAIDRFPQFIVEVLATGTVSSVSAHHDGVIYVKMDKPIKGCEAWDNCVQCDGERIFNEEFHDLAITQLEAALSIIWESDDTEEHAEWIKNTCAVLRGAGSTHYAIAKGLDYGSYEKTGG